MSNVTCGVSFVSYGTNVREIAGMFILLCFLIVSFCSTLSACTCCVHTISISIKMCVYKKENTLNEKTVRKYHVQLMVVCKADKTVI